MIFICSSTYCEAKPIIEKFDLEKDKSIYKFEVFKNSDIVIIISGEGAVNTVAATTYMINKFEINKQDILFNIGICKSKSKALREGEIVLCNEIFNYYDKKTFYQDILFSHPFIEGSLATISKDLIRNNINEINQDFLDEYGGFFMECASIFLPAYRIFCIKIICGNLNYNNLDYEITNVEDIIKLNLDSLISWIKSINNNTVRSKSILSVKDMDYINEIIENLKLSKTHQDKLKELCINYKMKQDNLVLALEPFTQIFCDSVKNGEIYFEKLIQQLEFINNLFN